MKVAGEENEGDERYQDEFYRDMTEFYDHHHRKHDSPCKRLVKQKTRTIEEKLANPELKHTQLYLNENNLKREQVAWSDEQLSKRQWRNTQK